MMKYANQRLHHLFDTCDMIEETPINEESDDAFEKPIDSNVAELKSDCHSNIQSGYAAKFKTIVLNF